MGGGTKMVSLLSCLLGRKESPADTAQRRLGLVLVMDRVGLAPALIDSMKTEIIQVVSQYLVVDEESIELEVKRSADRVILVSNIPVKELVRAAVAQ